MKKLNNKGFTLVELLAVLVILLLISALAIPSISSSLERNTARQDEAKREVIYSATELYLSAHKNYRTNFRNGTCCVTVQSLVDEELLDSKDTLDSNDKTLGTYVCYRTNAETGLLEYMLDKEIEGFTGATVCS